MVNERSLKIFYEVATKLIMTEAAGSLFLSQPAVSQTIGDLETAYDVRFFDWIWKQLVWNLGILRPLKKRFKRDWESLVYLNDVFSSLIGIGGGVIIVPALVFIF